MADEIHDAMVQNAQGPAEVSGDEGTVRQHSLRDQIAADRYQAGRTAATTAKRGLRFNKLIPPGAI